MNNTEIITLVQNAVKSVRTRNNNAKKVVVECNNKESGEELYQCIQSNPGYFFQKGSYESVAKGVNYKDFTFTFADTTQAAYFKEKIQNSKSQTIDYDSPDPEAPAGEDGGGVSGVMLIIIAAVVLLIALVLWKKRR